jgi:hypothetical protein
MAISEELRSIPNIPGYLGRETPLHHPEVGKPYPCGLLLERESTKAREIYIPVKGTSEEIEGGLASGPRQGP